MLKNEKVLTNNGNIIKGTHLESYIFFDNATATNIQVYYSTNSLATTENPLYIYIYDGEGYGLRTITSSQTEQIASYNNPNAYGTDRYMIIYGNLDSLTYFRASQYPAGDLIGFLNEFSNLEEINLYSDKFSSVNLNNYKWNGKMKRITINDSDLTGDIGTMTGLENLEYLNINGTLNFGGDIANLDALTYLNVDAYPEYYTLNSDVTDWNFLPNLTYLRLWYGRSITGSMTNWQFNSSLTDLILYNLDSSSLGGYLTNWDFSQCSELRYFRLSFATANDQNITGALSGWTFHNDVELTQGFYFRYSYMTDIGIDLSNITDINAFWLYNHTQATNNIGDIELPDAPSLVTTSIQYCQKMGGDINDFHIPLYSTSITIHQVGTGGQLTGDVIEFFNNAPTGITSFNVYENYYMTGNISGLTLWDGLVSCNIRGNDITGTVSPSMTIPDSLVGFYVSSNDVVIDMSSTFDFKNVTSIYFNHISGFTGNFSNLVIPDVNYVSMQSNIFDIDVGNIPINWNIIRTLRMEQCTLNTTCDLTNYFSGSTSDIVYLYIHTADYTGDVTNWVMGDWGGYNVYSYCYLYNTDLYGDVGNWGSPLPRYFYIYGTDISGDIGNLDFTTNGSQWMALGPCGLTGDLSGVTLDYRARNFNVGSCTGITGADNWVDYVWLNRKNWTQTFYNNIQNIADSITGTVQLGDLGTYTGDKSDLTEAEINNLVLGNDYDGLGSNTPWTQGEKVYYMENATVNSGSSTKKYYCNDWVV